MHLYNEKTEWFCTIPSFRYFIREYILFYNLLKQVFHIHSITNNFV